MDLDQYKQELENKTPLEIVRWAVKTFSPRLAMSSSFGPESGILLHMASEVDPGIPVLFLDTGYHFPETLAYRDTLVKLFRLTNVVALTAEKESKALLMERYGPEPYAKNPDECCRVHKVEPMLNAVRGYAAWMSGIRRHQTDFRKSVESIELYENGIYKISPLVNLTSRDAWWYLKEHQIPVHPLYEKGYLSIGCWPCTRPIQVGDDERSGRWAGKTKKECGIHTCWKEVKKEKEKEPPKDLGASL